MPYDLHSPWRKSSIMPIWSIQLLLVSVDLIIMGLVISITANTPDQTVRIDGKNVVITSGTQSWGIANLVIAAFTILLTCGEVVLYLYRDLSPILFLGSSLVKALAWTVVIVLDCLAFNSNWEHGQWNVYILYVVIGFAAACYIILVSGAIYGIVILRRHNKAIADNVDRYMKSGEAGSLASGY